MASAAGNWKDLVKACEKGDTNLVEYWLERGVDPNYQHPEYQHTALMATARAGHTDVLKVLVEHGANPHATSDFDGTDTALDFAVDAGRKEAAAYLRGLGVMSAHTGASGSDGSGTASAWFCAVM